MGFFSKTKKEDKGTVEPVAPWTAFVFGLMHTAAFSGFTDKELDFVDSFQDENENEFKEAVKLDEQYKNATIGEAAKVIAVSLNEEQVWVLHANIVELILVETSAEEFLSALNATTQKSNFEEHTVLELQIGFMSAIIIKKFGSNNPEVEEMAGNNILTIVNKNNLSVFNS